MIREPLADLYRQVQQRRARSERLCRLAVLAIGAGLAVAIFYGVTP